MDLPPILSTFPELQFQHEDYNALHHNLADMIGGRGEQDVSPGDDARPDLTPNITVSYQTESMHSVVDTFISSASRPQVEQESAEFGDRSQRNPELGDGFGTFGLVGYSHTHPTPLYLSHPGFLASQQEQADGPESNEHHNVLPLFGAHGSSDPISINTLGPEHVDYPLDDYDFHIRNSNNLNLDSTYAGQRGGQDAAQSQSVFRGNAFGMNSPPAMNTLTLQRPLSPPDTSLAHLAQAPPMFSLENEIPTPFRPVLVGRNTSLEYTGPLTVSMRDVANGQGCTQTLQPFTYNFAETNYSATRNVEPNKAQFHASFERFQEGNTLFSSSVEAQQRVLALGIQKKSKKRKHAPRNCDGSALTHEGEDLSSTSNETPLFGLGISFNNDNLLDDITNNMQDSSHHHSNARPSNHMEAPNFKRKAVTSPMPNRPSTNRFRTFRHPSSVSLGRVTQVPSSPSEQLFNYSTEVNNFIQPTLSNSFTAEYTGSESNTTDFNMPALRSTTHVSGTFIPENELDLSGIGAMHVDNTNTNNECTMRDNIIVDSDITMIPSNITNNITSNSPRPLEALANHAPSTSPIPSPPSPVHAALQSALENEETSTEAILQKFLPLRPTLLLEHDSPLLIRLVHSRWGSPSEIIAPIPSSFYRGEVIRKLVEKEEGNRVELRAQGYLDNLEEVVRGRVTEEMVQREKVRFADRVRKRMQGMRRDLGWGERWR